MSFLKDFKFLINKSIALEIFCLLLIFISSFVEFLYNQLCLKNDKNLNIEQWSLDPNPTEFGFGSTYK